MQELTIRARVNVVNKLIGIVAAHGPRTLFSVCQDRRARMGLDKVLQVWYVDELTGMMLYPFGDDHWYGFTGGPNKRALVAMLANFARDNAAIDLDRLPALLDGYSDDHKRQVLEAIIETIPAVVALA